MYVKDVTFGSNQTVKVQLTMDDTKRGSDKWSSFIDCNKCASSVFRSNGNTAVHSAEQHKILSFCHAKSPSSLAVAIVRWSTIFLVA